MILRVDLEVLVLDTQRGGDTRQQAQVSAANCVV
jgi:hypothetical protein